MGMLGRPARLVCALQPLTRCNKPVTGIATAYMDSVPIVAITANVAVNLLGRDTFQEVDIAGVTMPITKHTLS